MENKNELWLQVLGFEGLYEVSNLGNVRSLSRKVATFSKGCLREIPGRILSKQVAKRGGYLIVHLHKDEYRVCAKVHRLVAQAWIHNKYYAATVNHKNGIKEDNRVENLEWATIKENLNHARRTGLMKKPEKGMNGFKVFAFKDGEKVGEYPSIRMAGESLGVFGQNICSNLKGRVKSVKGYTFKLAS